MAKEGGDDDGDSGADSSTHHGSNLESGVGGIFRSVLRQQLRALKRMKVKPNKVADQLTYAYEFKKHVSAVDIIDSNASSGSKLMRRLRKGMLALPGFLRSSVVGFATFAVYDVNKDLYKKHLQPISSSGASDTVFATMSGLTCGFIGGFLQLLLEGKIVSLPPSGGPDLAQYKRTTVRTSMITFSVLFGSYEATKNILSCSNRGAARKADDAEYYLLIACAGGVAGLASETAAAVCAEKPKILAPPLGRSVMALWSNPTFVLSAILPSLLGFVAYEFDEE